jgi:hypothetical protein
MRSKDRAEKSTANSNRGDSRKRGPKNGTGVGVASKPDVRRSAREKSSDLRAVERKRKQWRNLAAPGAEGVGGKIKEGSVRGIFYRRAVAWARNLAENAPAEVLQEALSSTSARGTIVHVLGSVPVEKEKSEEETLLERAQERAVLVQDQLRREAGGLQNTQWVVDRLGVTRQTVDRYRKEGKLLALETPHGFQFPTCQFDADRIVPGLDAVLAAMEGVSFWETLSGLITPTELLDGRSILDALRATDEREERERVVSVARAYAEE